MAEAPRVLIISERAVRSIVPATYWYEYEDVISAIDHVDVVAPQLTKPSLRTAVNDWATRLRRRTRRRFGPIQPVKLDRDYELLFVISPSLHSRLDVLEFVQGWEQRCRVKILYAHELWEKQLRPTLTTVRRHWQRFDEVIAGLPGSREAATRLFGKPVTVHPGAVDAFKFCPPDPLSERPIDVANVGRRSGAAHQALLDWAERNGRWYEYDTTDSCRVLSHGDHRALLAERLKRTKYFIANPAQFNNPALRGNQQEIAMRHFEGAATGTVMIGQPPECDARQWYFDWPDAIVPVESNAPEVVDVIDDLESSPDRVARIRLASVRQTLLRHDWSHRWRHVLEVAGLAVTERHRQREEQLRHRAESLATEEGLPATPDRADRR